MFDPTTQLPWTGLTLGTVRTQLSGLHFAKETLSEGEQQILYYAEALLRLIDEAPKEMFVVMSYGADFDQGNALAFVPSLQRAREVIAEDVAKLGEPFAIEDFEEDEQERTLSATVLLNGSDSGAYYHAYTIPVR